MKEPLVSIVLPAYNAEQTIKCAVDSILNQTYLNWELLLINDGSTDNTKSIMMQYSDKRIRLIDNEVNMGLIYTLNRGLKEAHGEFIARMDADDECLPFRLEKQVAYMLNHPSTIVCGGFIKTFGNGVKSELKEYKVHNKEIKDAYPLQPPFAHPTVMIRTTALRQYNIIYDIEYKDAEDYKMWFDLMDRGDFYNIPEVLLNYRISDTQCTQKTNFTMQESTHRCMYNYAKKYLGAELADSIKNNNLSAKKLKQIKQICGNKYLIESAYYSIKVGDINTLLYYFISGDVLKYNLHTTGSIIKRFLGLRNIIY